MEGDPMPKRTSAATRAQIIDEYVINGLSQDEIADKLEVSKGVVNDTIQQAINGTLPRFEDISDHVEEAHRLSAELKKSGHPISDFYLGAAILKKFSKLGVEPKEIDLCIKSIHRIATDDTQAAKMLEVGTKLAVMEEKFSVDFVELPDKMEQLLKKIESEKKQLNELSEKRAKTEEEIKRLTREKQEVIKKVAYVENIEKRLARHQMKLENVDSFEEFITQSMKMGFDLAALKVLTRLGNALAIRGKDSKSGLILIDTLLALEEQGIDINTAKSLGQELAARGLKGNTASNWLAEQCKKGLDMKKAISELEEKTELTKIDYEEATKSFVHMHTNIKETEDRKRAMESAVYTIEERLTSLQKQERETKERMEKKIDFNRKILDSIKLSASETQELMNKRLEELNKARAIQDILRGTAKELPESMIKDLKAIVRAHEAQFPPNKDLLDNFRRFRREICELLLKLCPDIITPIGKHRVLSMEFESLKQSISEMVPKEQYIQVCNEKEGLLQMLVEKEHEIENLKK